MLCENCKTNSATFHYKHSENGNIKEAHLCSECAKNLGFLTSSALLDGGLFSGKSIFDEFFDGGLSSFLIGSPYKQETSSKQRICQRCGMSEREFRKNGKFGCSECYNSFSDLCRVILQKLHSSTEYKGKKPSGICENASSQRKLEKLRKDLQSAVEAQEYENAAKIRDAIKLLEENIKDENSEKRG